MYKLHGFADDLVLTLQEPLDNIEHAMKKLKIVGELMGDENKQTKDKNIG